LSGGRHRTPITARTDQGTTAADLLRTQPGLALLHQGHDVAERRRDVLRRTTCDAPALARLRLRNGERIGLTPAARRATSTAVADASVVVMRVCETPHESVEFFVATP
jgi:hypothetical protein